MSFSVLFFAPFSRKTDKICGSNTVIVKKWKIFKLNEANYWLFKYCRYFRIPYHKKSGRAISLPFQDFQLVVFKSFLSLNIRRDFSCLDKQVFSQENFCEKQIDGEERPEWQWTSKCWNINTNKKFTFWKKYFCFSTLSCEWGSLSRLSLYN